MGFSLKTFFGGITRKAKDNASDIMMGVGTGAVLGGTALLCRGAIKTRDILDEYKGAKAELIEDEAEKSDIRKLKAQTAGKVALALLPGALVEGAGLAGMWGGYTKMKTAFIGVGAAYTGLQEFIENYREGVREKYGDEVDQELAYHFRTEEVITQDEDGNQKTETVRIYPHDYKNMPSPYARYFAYGEATGAEHSITYNLHFLKVQQTTANAYLRANRKMMLNDLYDFLGIKRSVAGNRVGWIYDKNAPEGDNYIDLRIQEVYREREDDTGWEKVLMIDPNVDGMVEEKMVRLGLMDE